MNFISKYNEDRQKTELYYKNKLQLHLDGRVDFQTMLNTLHGYVLSSLTELPREIDYLKNNPYVRKGITVEALEKDLIEVKEINLEIDKYLVK